MKCTLCFDKNVMLYREDVLVAVHTSSLFGER